MDGEHLPGAALGGVVGGPLGRLPAGRHHEHPLAGQGRAQALRVAGLTRFEQRLDPQPIEFSEHRRTRADRPELYAVQLDQRLAV